MGVGCVCTSKPSRIWHIKVLTALGGGLVHFNIDFDTYHSLIADMKHCCVSCSVSKVTHGVAWLQCIYCTGSKNVFF